METILAGVADAFTLTNLFYIALGVFMGIMVGAIPGLNGPMAIAVAVPLTYYMSALTAVAFLIGINKGGTFGGSVAAILLNTPGSPESTSTALDGYPLVKKGKGLKALKMALYASVTGDILSDLVLFTVAAPLAIVALMMGPAEMAAIFLFSLTIIAGLSGKSLLRGLIAAVLGAFLSTVGLDIETAQPRMTLGMNELIEGIPIIPLTIGLLALSEIIIQIEARFLGREQHAPAQDVFGRSIPRENKRVSLAEYRQCLPTILRSAAIGTGVGAVPGIGAIVAGFLGYAAAKRSAKNPEEFGTGKLEGVAATEAANSAVVGANLIPLLALGIPGSLSAAILIGAFLIHGVEPGAADLSRAWPARLRHLRGDVHGELDKFRHRQSRAEAVRADRQRAEIRHPSCCCCTVYRRRLRQRQLDVFRCSDDGVRRARLFHAQVRFLHRHLHHRLRPWRDVRAIGAPGDDPVPGSAADLLQHPIVLFFIALTVFSLWRIVRASVRDARLPQFEEETTAREEKP